MIVVFKTIYPDLFPSYSLICVHYNIILINCLVKVNEDKVKLASLLYFSKNARDLIRMPFFNFRTQYNVCSHENMC